eukprot:CAMPEP_0178922424 /NCGR_PEP_ID=MMETSP0786-20121207/16146_1 /TAXON_ID=186022 /ORGANISM="Thalassionema frauenfeldii, Strain CCMP 1798" /LENGTH=225 /DNA_ID=CAMNT_0020596787 /DNA_START=44 /DNA_END=721 /DNA_ORIENTATION=+
MPKTKKKLPLLQIDDDDDYHSDDDYSGGDDDDYYDLSLDQGSGDDTTEPSLTASPTSDPTLLRSSQEIELPICSDDDDDDDDDDCDGENEFETVVEDFEIISLESSSWKLLEEEDPNHSNNSNHSVSSSWEELSEISSVMSVNSVFVPKSFLEVAAKGSWTIDETKPPLVPIQEEDERTGDDDSEKDNEYLDCEYEGVKFSRGGGVNFARGRVFKYPRGGRISQR